MNQKLRFRKGDLLAVALVVVLAAAVALAFLPKKEAAATVQIYQDGALVQTLPLDKDTTLQLVGSYTNTVTVQGGRAAITASDCPGTDCVHSGWISAAGRSVVCLPNRVEVRIVGASDVDFVVG